ncbi:hypothetical protein [Aquimarina sp. RZ0]|uniref:hypothetical protein n=1 Tax=Aquimarina sp. RZ0 TaxID=2607730 RepID=UPI0011F21855|nr:hypothetical protein [Aquimarina sp. RZ0]KAA1243119.1 hypothetical protein F0000_22425 [Aquimarina sp. RZ0]
MKKAFLCLLILIIGCNPSDDITIPDSNIIFTIDIENNAIFSGTRLFYSIKGEDGEDLAYGELFNSDKLEIKDLSYTGEKIAVTTFTVSEYSAAAKSYLDIPIGKSITLVNAAPFPDSSTKLTVNNFPTDFNRIVLARSGAFSPANFILDFTFTYQFYENLPLLCVTTITSSNNTPKFQTLNLENNSDQVIDLNNSIPMENIHNIFSKPSLTGDFDYAIALTGIKKDSLNPIGDYILYSDLDPGTITDTIQAYTPSDFQYFKLKLTAKQDNNIYTQHTNGKIPTMFDFIDPKININNSTFENMSISSTENNISYLYSSWKWNTKDLKKITWEIISEEIMDTKYKIQEIPDAILQKVGSLKDSKFLSLTSVSSVNTNNLEYTQIIDKLLINTSFRYIQQPITSFEKTLSKTIDVTSCNEQ